MNSTSQVCIIYMCKLNILCKEPDGKCSCSGPSALFQEKSTPISGILVSILDFLRTQPEIMRSLHESSSQAHSSHSSSESFTDRDSPITRDSSHEDAEDRSIQLLSEPIKKIAAGKSFSLLFNIIGTNSGLIKLSEPVTVTASIVGKYDIASKIELGRVATTGTIFFKKLVIPEVLKDALLVVTSTDDTDIRLYSQEIQINKRRRRGDDESLVKVPKIED